MLGKGQIIAAVGLLLVSTSLAAFYKRRRFPDRQPLIPNPRFFAWWMIVVGLVVTEYLASNPHWGEITRVVGFLILSLMALNKFFQHLPNQVRLAARIACYVAAVLQFYWVFIKWYGFFVVFVPVFLFLYLPASGMMKDESSSPLLQMGSVHWILMTAVFCLSHAAYIVMLPNGVELLFFVLMITELADAVRMVLARSHVRAPVVASLSVAMAVGVAWVVGPVFTPLSDFHILLAGLVLGIAGTVGFRNIQSLREELKIDPGSPLERVESLAYTAPLFLHAYRYFNYPLG